MNNKNEDQKNDLEIALDQAEIIKDDELKVVTGGGSTVIPNPDYFDVNPNDPKYRGCWFN